MENKIKNKKNEILKKLNMPREVITGEPKITIIGKEEIKIENHSGIKKFDKEMFILGTSIGELRIEGTGFKILFIEEETIIINGIFNAIYYGEKNNG